MATVLGSLNEAMHRAMERDPRVHLIGEDLLDPYGGAFKFSKGLSSRFEGRVWTTPISEAAIVGVSVGMALRGLRPVAEMMFGDFLTLAADQIVNHAAKFRWMFNDQVRVPMVIRAPMGARRGYGPTHSQTLDKHFLGVPGLWVVSPSIFGDPGVLLEQAIAHEDPVLFIESKTCYGRTIESAPQGMREEVRSADGEPFPTRRYVWADGGSDGLICCYGATAPLVPGGSADTGGRGGPALRLRRLHAAVPDAPRPHSLAARARSADLPLYGRGQRHGRLERRDARGVRGATRRARAAGNAVRPRRLAARAHRQQPRARIQLDRADRGHRVRSPRPGLTPQQSGPARARAAA